MRVRVISVFQDKYTDEIYEIGRILKVSKKRYEEIKEYVEIISESKKKINEVED